jgi:hypothetical protein
VSLGSQTQVVDGQRNTFPTWAQWAPQSWGPQTTGVPQVSPTIPPFIGAANTGGFSGAGMVESVGGYGTAGNNSLVAAISGANPHHWKVSPTWWVVVFLVVGLVLLRAIHWRDTVLEGFEESGRFGPASERAEERVG